MSAIPNFLDTELKNNIISRTSIDFGNQTTITNIRERFINESIIFLPLIVSAVIIYYASIDPDALSSKTYYYAILVMLPIALGLGYTTKIFNYSKYSNSTKLMLYGLVIFFIAIFIFVSTGLTGADLVMFNFISSTVFYGIIIVGLAIGFYVFSNYLKKQTGAAGFIIQLIFYIPCLFSDFLKYFLEQMKITPNIVFILFILEILLILLYLGLPYISTRITTRNTKELLKQPVFLNEEKTIASSKIFILEDKSAKNNDNLGAVDILNTPSGIVYRSNNYALSFWVFVNQQSISNTSNPVKCNILNYANGKPQVYYLNDGNTHRNKFVVYFSNKQTTREQSKYEITLEQQKWHNFVFNYYGTNCDLFVNGALLRTMKFTKDTQPDDGKEEDTIVVGSNNGLHGAICNVNYYTNPLSIMYITNTYNMMMNQNPPVSLM